MTHYYDENQESQDKRFLIEIKLKDDSFKLTSSSGIFSKDELDDATKLLIERAQIDKTSKTILDLGCGYGVVGIALLRRNSSRINVTFSDINERAVDLTRENLKELKLIGKVVKSNLFTHLEDYFDTILTNPPYAAGREVCYKLIEDSFTHLNKDGTLQIVARHNKGGSMLMKKMQEVFGNETTIAKSKGFHVYLSRKK